MADYIWECNAFPPRVGVTKEKRGSIFLHDKTRPYKAWWNGCGISEGTKTLNESKKIALEYMKQHAIEEREKAYALIGEATKALAQIERELTTGVPNR